jgi:hypothetical protein
MNEDQNVKSITKSIFITDFSGDNSLTKAETMFFIIGENVSSPMGGGIAAFTNADSAKHYKTNLQAQDIDWNSVINK